MPSGTVTPAGGGGGSTPFNGGTITQPLVVDSAGTPAALLDVVDSTHPTFDMQFFEEDFGLGNINAKLTVRGSGSKDGQIVLRNGAGTSNVTLNSLTGLFVNSDQNVSGAELLRVDSAWWGTLIRVLSQAVQFGAPVYFTDGAPPTLQSHSAPTDGSLAAGDCALWFDQTDGAGNTKLMVKAKSANGTVKTATILLT